jgi:hypothetical protein
MRGAGPLSRATLHEDPRNEGQGGKKDPSGEARHEDQDEMPQMAPLKQ